MNGNFSPLKTIEKAILDAKDNILVKNAAAGDENAFSTLVSLHKKKVAALGFSFFKNAEDADDFVQDVFLCVFRTLKSFRGESSFSTWLMRLSYNLASTAKNRRKDYLPISDEESINSEYETPEEEEIKRVTKEAIKESVASLPEKYALCVELYFFYDKSYEEISGITSLPLNTIKSHIFRAKRILREKLREFYEK